MERPPLCAIALLAWAHLCWACDVDQSPSLLVASKEHSTISCKVTAVPGQHITTSIFLKDEPKIQLNKNYILTNTSTPTIIQHNFPTTKSGTYICRVTCGNETIKDGKGTYIYVRDSGYEEPIGPAGTLQRGMIALLVLLLLLSASGTYLVLPFHRKKQGKPSKSSGAPAVTSQPTTLQPEEETCGSLYTSLQPHSDDVYDILDEEIPRKTSVELHAEVHGVLSHSPMKRPKPQAKSTPIHEKPQPVPNKPPIKQKPKNAMADNSLYENLKR